MLSWLRVILVTILAGVRVQFNAKGLAQHDPGLSDRFSRAYDRRMGL